MLNILLLQAFVVACRTDAALVHPVAVGIEAVLDVIFVDTHFELMGYLFGLFPGCHFQFDQLEVSVVAIVLEQGMASLVQERPCA